MALSQARGSIRRRRSPRVQPAGGSLGGHRPGPWGPQSVPPPAPPPAPLQRRGRRQEDKHVRLIRQPEAKRRCARTELVRSGKGERRLFPTKPPNLWGWSGTGTHSSVFESIFFKLMCSFLRERVSEKGAEGEGDPEPEAGSRLRAVGTEPDAGLEPTDREIVT